MTKKFLTLVASSTLASTSINLRSSGLVNSPKRIVLQSRFANLASAGVRCGGLSINSCTAIEDIEGCLVLLGLGGYRASLKLCLCCAALLGLDICRLDKPSRGERDASILDLEDPSWGACVVGEVEALWSRLGVVMIEEVEADLACSRLEFQGSATLNSCSPRVSNGWNI